MSTFDELPATEPLDIRDEIEELSEEQLEECIADEHSHVLDKVEAILELAYRGLDTDRALTRIQGVIDDDSRIGTDEEG